MSSGSIPSDPLRAFPTDVSQRIFSRLSIRDLARCSRVSKKWNRSQTLNYGELNLMYDARQWDVDGVPSLVPTLPERELPRRQLAPGQVDQARVEAELGMYSFIRLAGIMCSCLLADNIPPDRRRARLRQARAHLSLILWSLDTPRLGCTDTARGP